MKKLFALLALVGMLTFSTAPLALAQDALTQTPDSTLAAADSTATEEVVEEVKEETKSE